MTTAPILDPIADDAMEYDECFDAVRAIYRSPKREDENLFDIEQHGSMLISGRGHQSDIDCGKPNIFYWSGTTATHSVYHCREQGCPVCFRYWASWIAARGASFIEAVAPRLIRERAYAVYHCVLSPGVFRGWRHLINTLSTLMSRFHDDRSYGDVGYCYVKHPYRVHCRHCHFSNETHNLPFQCPRCGAEKSWSWYFSPHLHLLTNFVFRRDRSGQFSKFLKRRDCVFVNITRRSKKFFTKREHVVAVLSYELGHCLYELRDGGQGKGGKALVWKAGWHPNHLKRRFIRFQDVVADAAGKKFLPVVVTEVHYEDVTQLVYQHVLKADGKPVYSLTAPLLFKTRWECKLEPRVKVHRSEYERYNYRPKLDISAFISGRFRADRCIPVGFEDDERLDYEIGFLRDRLHAMVIEDKVFRGIADVFG